MGDIVHVSNTQTIGQFRAWQMGGKKGEFRGKQFSQQWSSTLFMVTHIKGSPIPSIEQPTGQTTFVVEAISDTTHGAGIRVETLQTAPIFDEPGVSPGIFLTPVWEAWKSYRGEKAVYGSKHHDVSGGLWWESTQSLSNLSFGCPHSLLFYLEQQKQLLVNPTKFTPKDCFCGFIQSELACVDANTQEHFWPVALTASLHSDFLGNVMDPKDKLAHNYKVEQVIYGKKNRALHLSMERSAIMDHHASLYSRCLHKQQKSKVTISRGHPNTSKRKVLSLVP